MKILELKLKSTQVSSLKAFYGELIGVEIVAASETTFTIELPQSKLTFEQARESFLYHYCFLIPSNKVHEAIEWLSNKLTPITHQESTIVKSSDAWNAESIYFLDAAGNIAEFIARHDLGNKVEEDFNAKHILSVSEIGLAVDDVVHTLSMIAPTVNLPPYHGSIDRFYPVGDLEGLILLVNKENKKVWFPTAIPTQTSPFDLIFEEKGTRYHMTFENGKISIIRI